MIFFKNWEIFKKRQSENSGLLDDPRSKNAQKYGLIPGKGIEYPGYLHEPNISSYCLSLSISKIRFDFVFIVPKCYMKNCV